MHGMLSLRIIIGVVCKPFLGGPTTPVCTSNNENLIFTCKGSQVNVLQWKSKPDVFKNNDIFFSFNSMNGTKYNVSDFLILANIDNVNITLKIANLTSTLTVPTSIISNKTVIICETSSTGSVWQSSFITLTTAGILYSNPTPQSTLPI